MNDFVAKLILPVFLILLVFACESNRQKIDTSENKTVQVQKNVIIYGSENCDHCIEFRKYMDAAKFTYEFKDAEASEQVYQELLKKIQLANYKGYVSFPVLDIEGKIYVKPEFSTIRNLLSN